VPAGLLDRRRRRSSSSSSSSSRSRTSLVVVPSAGAVRVLVPSEEIERRPPQEDLHGRGAGRRRSCSFSSRSTAGGRASAGSGARGDHPLDEAQAPSEPAQDAAAGDAVALDQPHREVDLQPLARRRGRRRAGRGEAAARMPREQQPGPGLDGRRAVDDRGGRRRDRGGQRRRRRGARRFVPLVDGDADEPRGHDEGPELLDSELEDQRRGRGRGRRGRRAARGRSGPRASSSGAARRDSRRSSSSRRRPGRSRRRRLGRICRHRRLFSSDGEQPSPRLGCCCARCCRIALWRGQLQLHRARGPARDAKTEKQRERERVSSFD